MITDREALVEKVALAIQLADECEIPDDYSHGLDPNVSDWGAFLADAVIDLFMQEAVALRAENERLKQEARFTAISVLLEKDAEIARLKAELSDFRRFVKEQFGYEDAPHEETSA